MGAGASTPTLSRSAWQQGSMLPAGTAIAPSVWAHHRSQLDAKVSKQVQGATGPRLVERALKAKDRFVVISQTCDVIKAPDLLAQVEVARVFTTTDSVVLAQARNFGSARYFLVNDDRDRPLIVDYGWRTLLDKGFLVECDPDNTCVDRWTAEQSATFTRWLGRRNGRPALSDLDVAEICDPIRRRFERLQAEEAVAAARYSEEFAEFRYRREADGTITLFLLSPKAAPDELLALELMDVLQEALGALKPRLASDKLSYFKFTKADELTTEQVDLFWASHEESEIHGALPPD